MTKNLSPATSAAISNGTSSPLVRYPMALMFWVLMPLVTSVLFMMVLLQQVRIKLFKLPEDGKPHHDIATLWGKINIFMIPGWKVHLDGLENLPPQDEPVVIVANHESMADIWAMFFLERQFRFFAKAETRKIPLIGQVMKFAGYIFIKRGDRNSATESMRKSREVLDSGISVMFFPEGTRSKDGRVKPFKMGAFKLARDAKVAVLPVAIHGAGVLFPKGSMIPNPAQIQVKVLPKMHLGEQDLSSFAEAVRDKIIQAHATLI